tara:strand:+ start:274 stop:465 length:192 start_codon:yes stop_codon:yes gene_type:complete
MIGAGERVIDDKNLFVNLKRQETKGWEGGGAKGGKKNYQISWINLPPLSRAPPLPTTGFFVPR